MSECCSRFQEAIRQMDEVLRAEGIVLGARRPSVVVDEWVADLIEELRNQKPAVRVGVSVIGGDGVTTIIPLSRVGWVPLITSDDPAIDHEPVVEP